MSKFITPKNLIITFVIMLMAPVSSYAADSGGSSTPATESGTVVTPTPKAKQTPDTTAKSLTTELTKIRSTIDAKDYKSARSALLLLNREFPNNDDVNNLLGYTSRKMNLLSEAATYYSKSLSINPKHLGALEYQGELFVQTKKLSSAKKNLQKLKVLCGVNCEEYKDLKAAIEKP
jgi:predicted Zn-dependent protease